MPALIRHDVVLMLVLSPERTLYSREGESDVREGWSGEGREGGKEGGRGR